MQRQHLNAGPGAIGGLDAHEGHFDLARDGGEWGNVDALRDPN
ncbi:hypothetical protein [Halorubrum aidingense]|nr:hypothetical protein [Halorubrum aidingense]